MYNIEIDKKWSEEKRMGAQEKIIHTFKEMFCEMEYEQITVKELACQAGIHRKTFYLYYKSLDELLKEIQRKLSDDYTELTKQYDRMKDTEIITKIFFQYIKSQGEFGEVVWGRNKNFYIYNLISDDTRKELWPDEGGKSAKEVAYVNMVLYYIQFTQMEMYRTWLKDGKKITLEELAEYIIELQCEGVDECLRHKNISCEK